MRIAIDAKFERIKKYETQFWSNVRRGTPNECWLWLRGHDLEGRAKVTVGSGATKITMAAARLLVCIQEGRFLAPEECVLHTCDNPKCVNPSHLWIGTKAENNKDRARKKRSAPVHGENNGHAKLTEADAIEAKYGPLSAKQYANKFGVHVTTIFYIRKGRLWGHI